MFRGVACKRCGTSRRVLRCVAGSGLIGDCCVYAPHFGAICGSQMARLDAADNDLGDLSELMALLHGSWFKLEQVSGVVNPESATLRVFPL